MIAVSDGGISRNPLDGAKLDELVAVPDSIWRRVEVVASTGSTNADLIARARTGEDVSGTVLVAENQTAGRGRNGRTWSAVPGAQLLMSVGIPSADLPVGAWGWVSLATGLAVVAAVADVAGVPSGLKWPNDVLAGDDGRKLAGILAEVATPAPVIVVGVGLNVSLRADEVPHPAATSLTMLGADDQDRTELICALLRELQDRIQRLEAAGRADDALVAEYVASSLTISARVRATLPGDREVVGTALSIDDHGRLCIDTGNEVVVVSAGDVVHLRPVDDPR
jgi:BirA family biotin operon repressor/biotin-[acetyl-CoA-carboxylase] ligase